MCLCEKVREKIFSNSERILDFFFPRWSIEVLISAKKELSPYGMDVCNNNFRFSLHKPSYVKHFYSATELSLKIQYDEGQKFVKKPLDADVRYRFISGGICITYLPTLCCVRYDSTIFSSFFASKVISINVSSYFAGKFFKCFIVGERKLEQNFWRRKNPLQCLNITLLEIIEF